MTYTWTIIGMIGYPQYEGDTDVVTYANYIVSADDGLGHIATYQGCQPTPLDPSAPFIPYPDLTPEIVTAWVQSSLGPEGVAGVYSNLDAKIAYQINPPPVSQSFPLPWNYGQTPPAPVN